MERANSKSAFIASLPFWLFLLLFVAGTLPTLLGLSERWLKFDESYSHGFLVLSVSVWLFAKKFKEERPVGGLYWPWLLPLVASVLLYLAGGILLIEAFQQIALLPILGSGILALWGWRQSLTFVVPVALMGLTLPFWDYLSWPLQLITVAINEKLLAVFGIEFVVEGVFVYFPGVGAFEVAHGCSGLRYLLVGVTLALLYGELNLNEWRNRWLLLAFGILFALVANWVRVFIIIYVGYESNMTSPLIEEHDFFGWWVFAATLVPLYFIGRRLESREAAECDGERNSTAKLHESATDKSTAVVQFVILLPVLALVAATWLMLPAESEGIASKQIVSAVHDANLIDDNQWLPLFGRNLAGWRPEIARPDKVMEKSYSKRQAENIAAQSLAPTQNLLVALYSYDYQRPRREVVQYGNRLYDSSKLIPEQTFEVDADDGVSLSGLTLRYRQSEQTIHLAYGYYVEGQWERNELTAKLAQLPGMFSARNDASLLVIGLECVACDGQEELQEVVPGIQASAQSYLDNLYTRER